MGWGHRMQGHGARRWKYHIWQGHGADGWKCHMRQEHGAPCPCHLPTSYHTVSYRIILQIPSVC